MSEEKVTVRMDRSSWSQIVRDLEKFYGFDVEDSEVWESVEVLRTVQAANGEPCGDVGDE